MSSKNLHYGVLISLLLLTVNTHADNLSGLWLDSTNNYWALLQTETPGSTAQIIALQLSDDLQSSALYIGESNAATLQLTELNGAQLAATLDNNTRFQGTLTQGNQQHFRAANLLFRYQGSLYDGIWQLDNNNYLLLLTLRYAASPVTALFHLDFTNTVSPRNTLYLGSISNAQWTGRALLNEAQHLQLNFSTTTRLNSQLTLAEQSSSGSAEKLLSLAQANPLAATLTVTNTQDSGAGSLRHALAAAQAGDYIAFAPSLANQTITLSSGQLVINKTLTLDGYDAPGLTLNGNQQHRLFDIQKDAQNNAVTVTMRHLALTQGRTFATDEAGAGAAIRTANFSTLIVEHCYFSRNVTGGAGGGGIFAGWQSNTTVINSRFEQNDGTLNKKERGGGAIATKSGSQLVVKDSYFSHNTGINGGAINSLLGELTVINSIFLNNEAIPERANTAFFGLGGAILTDGANASGPNFGPGNVGGEIIIQHSYFANNRALNGGALNLYAYPPDKVLVENSVFVENQAIKNSANESALGGGVRHDNSEFIVRNSSFYNNYAQEQGGGLWVDKNSPTTLTNVTFSGNKAGEDAAKNGLGGGLTIYSPATIINATFVKNYATGHSGALFTGQQANIKIANSLFANNAIGENFPPLQTLNRQLIEGGNNLQAFPLRELNDLDKIKVTSGVTLADPKLGEIQVVNGMLLHPLLADSPAIDAANSQTAPARDASGKLRPLDGNGDGRAVSDIGAYEY